jgi:glycosyltransferase involved in cell wall biosynthesis
MTSVGVETREGVAPGRLRVLLLAEMANPDWVSVPLEGWSHAQAISRRASAHLVTHGRNRENILKAGLREGEDFTSIISRSDDALWTAGSLLGAKWGTGWTTRTAIGVLSYFAFERAVWKLFEQRIRDREFDVVHRLTPLSPTTPSPIAARCADLGVPFVLGPLNGGVPWPKGFGGARLKEREFLSYLRGAYRLLPGYRSTRDSASALITGSRDTRIQVGSRWQDKTVYVPENGVEPTRFDLVADGPVVLPLKVVFVGRLVPYKCPDVLIEAAAPLVREGRLQVEILGDGPFMPALRDLVTRLGLESGVNLAGWVAHKDLKRRLSESHVFAFPSVREFGGAVVLEAMATGLVPVVVDYGGPGELVSEQTGFRIPMGQKPSLVSGFRSVLERMVADPSRLREMGRKARDRVLRDFTWDAKAAQTLEVYRWALGQRDRPDFGMPLPDPATPGSAPGPERGS